MNDIEVIECERPTNLEEIAKFESLINAKLPEDYKQFLLKYNGGHPVYDGYKLVKPINEKTNEAGIDWFYALYDGDVCNISKQFYRSREELPEEVIPIGSDSGGKVSHQDEFYTEIEIFLNASKTSICRNLYEIINRLFNLFDGFEIEYSVVEGLFNRLINRRL